MNRKQLHKYAVICNFITEKKFTGRVTATHSAAWELELLATSVQLLSLPGGLALPGEV